ncbi:MAG: S41 family peptidase [Verrucomicrobiota bacterium]
MLRFTWPALIGIFLVTNAMGQSPAPPAASPNRPPTPSKATATPSPSPSATPTTDELIDSLTQQDLQAIITLLKSNFTNPDVLTEAEINRATVQGLIDRLSHGVMLLPGRQSAKEESVAPLYSEILEEHIGYLRLGAFNSTNLEAMDKALSRFAIGKADAVIVDLRASGPANDFAIAAEFAKRFCPKGKQLIKVHKPAARQDRVFTSDRDPAFRGLITVLIDSETAGGAETVAGALRIYDKAMIIGQPSAGRAVEYSDLPLPSGKILRVAVAEAALPEGPSIFPGGIKPDLPVEMSMVDKHQIFQRSTEKGMGPFVYETERPHMNEAALLAGTNPEVDAAEAAQRRRERGPEKPGVHDLVLQRALDLVTSLEIYEKR